MFEKRMRNMLLIWLAGMAFIVLAVWITSLLVTKILMAIVGATIITYINSDYSIHMVKGHILTLQELPVDSFLVIDIIPSLNAIEIVRIGTGDLRIVGVFQLEAFFKNMRFEITKYKTEFFQELNKEKYFIDSGKVIKILGK